MALLRALRLLVLTTLLLWAGPAIATSPYAPINATCPSTPLVRASTTLSTSEQQYIKLRGIAANKALASWLNRINSTFSTAKLPVIGLTTSGGGYRSLLTGAGVVQAFDSRDSNATVRGLYQALTYHSGLSGGGWMVSSFMGNNFPTVSSLRDYLWGPGFQQGLLDPQNPLHTAAITLDVTAKNLSGFSPTAVDIYGRALSYQMLQGPNGGVATTMSSATRGSAFRNYQAPYPILTALQANVPAGSCTPSNNATQYELSPYEFGSWDAGVSAFTPTQYLGTNVSNGQPTGNCTTGYDNLGYMLGTSSALFNYFCNLLSLLPYLPQTQTIAQILPQIHPITIRDMFAVFTNPFYNSSSTAVSNLTELDLVDGGETHQNNPIWPFLQPQRQVNVLVVNDNSADVNNFPDGSELYMTYTQSQASGLTKMPTIPPVSVFTTQGLNRRPVFFGCRNPNALTIIYLPNTRYTFASNVSTFQTQYSQQDTNAMIANGGQVATRGGDSNWPTCLACGIMLKTGSPMPAACKLCLGLYCYN